MIFEQTTDLNLVRAIVTNPKCWGRMADDSAPPPEKLEVIERDNCRFIVARQDDGLLAGLFLLVSVGVPAVAEVHFCLLPSVWGSGEEIGRAFLAWVWRETSLKVLRGNVPSHNRLALKTALACGFIVTGVTDDAVQKGGEPYAVIHTEVQRP